MILYDMYWPKNQFECAMIYYVEEVLELKCVVKL